MATITAFTAERSQEIEDQAIVDGAVVGDNLILIKHNGESIDAGSVRGPTGSPGISSEEFDAAIADINDSIAAGMPVSSVIDYMGLTPPTNFLTMVGQTIAGAQSLYPTWWAVVPSALKSGSDVIMPDTRKCVTVGYDITDTDFNAIGKTGGAKTVTLTTAQTPIRSHSHGTTDTGHSHTVNSHSHGGATQNANPAHIHSGTTGAMNSNASHTHTPGGSGFPIRYDFVYQTESGFGSVAFTIGGGPYDINAVSTTSAANIDHTHDFNTASANLTHLHGINAESPGTNSVVTGLTVNAYQDTSATAHNNMPPFVTFLKIVKVA